MKNYMESRKRGEGGFIEIIVIVIIALLLMKYFGVTVSTVVNWVRAFVDWFTSYFKDILK